MSVTPEAKAAEPTPVVSCTQLQIDSSHVRIKCTVAGLIVLNTVVDLPTVTLPPLPAVTLPGATVTVKVTPRPGPTQTVTAPSGTKTVLVPGPTKTVEVKVPTPIKPSVLPGKTVTADGKTVTVSPKTGTGQTDNPSATVSPEPDKKGPVFLDFPDSPRETVTVAGIGLLVGLITAVLALFAGYWFGYKDAEKESVTFMRALSDKMISGRKH